MSMDCMSLYNNLVGINNEQMKTAGLSAARITNSLPNEYDQANVYAEVHCKIEI